MVGLSSLMHRIVMMYIRGGRGGGGRKGGEARGGNTIHLLLEALQTLSVREGQTHL